MVVRVRLRVKSLNTNKSIELIVLANGGAESPKPCIAVNTEIAGELGLWPLTNAEIYFVEEATITSQVYLLPNSVELNLVSDEGDVLDKVIADLVIQEGLREPLITDITIDELGIQIISFSKGLWRHKKDSPNIIRRSPRINPR